MFNRKYVADNFHAIISWWLGAAFERQHGPWIVARTLVKVNRRRGVVGWAGVLGSSRVFSARTGSSGLDGGGLRSRLGVGARG